MKNLMATIILHLLATSSFAASLTINNPYRLNAPVYEFNIPPRHHLEVIYDFLHEHHQLACTSKTSNQQGIFIHWINPKESKSTSHNFPITIKNKESLAGEWSEDYGMLSISNFNNEKQLIVSCEYSELEL